MMMSSLRTKTNLVGKLKMNIWVCTIIKALHGKLTVVNGKEELLFSFIHKIMNYILDQYYYPAPLSLTKKTMQAFLYLLHSICSSGGKSQIILKFGIVILYGILIAICPPLLKLSHSPGNAVLFYDTHTAVLWACFPMTLSMQRWNVLLEK